MQQSVPSPSVVQATFAATLFDEWIRRGLSDVVVCPGSRSTPLVLAAAIRPELTTHVRIDERSAGFFALGRALVTGRPVAIVVTSGTAAAELHACVAEADQAFVPLLVVTADRPPELHGVGAPQTMDQHELYGPMVRRFEDPGVARLDATPTWRTLASRLWLSAVNAPGRSGPVHLNAAFVEPLIAEPAPLPEALDVAGPRWQTPIAEYDVRGRRVLCVVGRGASPAVVANCVAHDWVVIGDATSQGTLAYFDPLLRSDDFAAVAKPDVVVRIGGLPASKVLQERLRAWNVHTVGFDGAGFLADPDHLVDQMIPGLPDDATDERGDPAYVEMWRGASATIDEWLSSIEPTFDTLNEPLVARLVVRASSRGGADLVIGSSMPVRDVEWWSASRTAPTFANRGVNGIDGVVSTVLGVAAGGRAIGLIGDITLLHDVSGLVDGLGDLGGSCVLVVMDNHGGGIFSFLPHERAIEPAVFERFFATPREHDLARIATAFGHRSVVAKSPDELQGAIDDGLDAAGITVIIAKVLSREENFSLHEEWVAHVKETMASSS